MRRVCTVVLVGLLSACAGEDFTPIETELVELTTQIEVQIGVVADTVFLADPATSRRLVTVPPDEPSFIRGIIDAMLQQRRYAGGHDEDPWQFGAHPDGYWVFQDPRTGVLIDPMALDKNAMKDLMPLFGPLELAQDAS